MLIDMLWSILVVLATFAAGVEGDKFTCMNMPSLSVKRAFVNKPRRYDIGHMGRAKYFRGWADVQGLGAANDYCRIVGNIEDLVLTCALAGTSGESDRNYNSASKIDPGFYDTWYMKDEDGDGRDDYCRCVKNKFMNGTEVWCTAAGLKGFYGSRAQPGEEMTFQVSGITNCEKIKVYKEFGRKYAE